MANTATEVSLLYVTAPSLEEARTLARTLLDQRLIACANLLPQMESIYRWNEAIESAAEVVVILKTKKELVSQAIAAVEATHSYDTPCVLEIEVASGSAKYLAWLSAI